MGKLLWPHNNCSAQVAKINRRKVQWGDTMWITEHVCVGVRVCVYFVHINVHQIQISCPQNYEVGSDCSCQSDRGGVEKSVVTVETTVRDYKWKSMGKVQNKKGVCRWWESSSCTSCLYFFGRKLHFMRLVYACLTLAIQCERLISTSNLFFNLLSCWGKFQ